MHIFKQLTIIKSLLDNNVITHKEYDDLNKFLSNFLSEGSSVKEESTNRDIEIKSPLDTSTLDSFENKNNNTESSDKHISDITQKAKNKAKSKTLIIIVSIIVFLFLAATAYYFYTEKMHSDQLLIEQREKVKTDSTLMAEKARQDSIAAYEAKMNEIVLENDLFIGDWTSPESAIIGIQITKENKTYLVTELNSDGEPFSMDVSGNELINNNYSIELRADKKSIIEHGSYGDRILIKREAFTEDEILKLSSFYFIKSYYTALSNENFDANNWFESTVLNFISKTNTTPDEINQLHSSNVEFTAAVSNIDEGTFVFDRNEDGINYWKFENNFSCYRTSKQKYQSCKIVVEVGINSLTNKINSYKELKLSDLKFTIDKP